MKPEEMIGKEVSISIKATIESIHESGEYFIWNCKDVLRGQVPIKGIIEMEEKKKDNETESK